MTKTRNSGAEIISSFFENDHKEIDAIFKKVAFESPQDAVAQFKEFDRRLERHIHWEEAILFPAVAQRAPELEAGPIRVMLLEHEEIRDNKAAALKALRAGDGWSAKIHAQVMLRVLKDHNRKEEQILYPACDELLSPKEAEAVLEKVHALTPATSNRNG